MSQVAGPRVWMIDPISYTGMAYYDAGLCAALQARGLDVSLAGSDGWLLRDWTPPFRRLDIFRGTHGPRGILAKGVAYGQALVRLLAHIHRARPDVVHWQFLELAPADYFALHILRQWKVPQVYTAHELLPWDARAYNHRLFRRIFRTVDAVIVHNRRAADRLTREFGVDGDRISVIVHGDYDRFATPDAPQAAARATLGLPANAPVALFFGSLRASKGLEVLLAAWAHVTDALPDAVLAVVGKPYKRLDTAIYTGLVEQLGLRDRVVFRFEQVSPTLTNDYYRAADIVALPYHDIVTSGVLRYAYSSARAVVATAVGEHPDWVEAGVTGQLVPPRDPQALATALIALLGDRAHAEQMGRTALAYGRSHFAWPDIAAQTAAVYARVARAQGLSES